MYRSLTEQEITTLESRGCTAEDWSKVEVKEFNSSRLTNVQFRGWVKVGVQSELVELSEGIEVFSALRDVVLHNCEIGDNVYISGVRQYISNYRIGDNVIISGVDSIIALPGATFGQGVRISPINEAGGREVAICDKLSSQTAYIYALYRERTKLTSALERMVEEYALEVQSRGAYIGRGAIVCNCGEIRDVNIGAGAYLDGVSKLVDGSINSTLSAPCYIGRGVTSEHFIISSAAKVTDGALLDRCFVGQGCEIGKQFSAENSLFFSNCIAMHGEACSIFAGPYTVTHHKSTLLIGGMFSFLNAGSNSNQSNHFYKFGPIHQGIVERGTKLASGSYMMWPMRVGAFSLVLGKHYSNCDSSALPFSYLIEQKYGEPSIIPGANLRSVGVVRDAAKWPQRDKRGYENRLDRLSFRLLNPYTVGKIIEGKELLCSLLEGSDTENASGSYLYNGLRIKEQYLKRGISYYEDAIYKYLGGILLRRLESSSFESIEDLRKILATSHTAGEGQWLDISGLICPQSSVERLVRGVESGEVNSIDMLLCEFKKLDEAYDSDSWVWARPIIEAYLGESLSEVTVPALSRFIERYKEAIQTIDSAIIEDAKKEFSEGMQVGYGIDCGDEHRASDFSAVRGRFEQNDFVRDLQTHCERKNIRIATILSALEAIG